MKIKRTIDIDDESVSETRYPYTDRYGREFLFRSSYELTFAEYLDDCNIDWNYEEEAFPVTFLDKYGKETRRNYIPDFYDISNNRYYEVKGEWLGYSYEKVEAFRKQYPMYTIDIIQKDDIMRQRRILTKRKTKQYHPHKNQQTF